MLVASDYSLFYFFIATSDLAGYIACHCGPPYWKQRKNNLYSRSELEITAPPDTRLQSPEPPAAGRWCFGVGRCLGALLAQSPTPAACRGARATTWPRPDTGAAAHLGVSTAARQPAATCPPPARPPATPSTRVWYCWSVLLSLSIYSMIPFSNDSICIVSEFRH